MHLTENFKQAFLSLTTNKLRSILTMLGIIMGVFSIVAIMAISNATKVYISSELGKLGANTIIIQATGSDLEDRDRLTMKDMDSIVRGVDEVENITAAVTFYSSIRLEEGNRDALIAGVTSQYTSFQTIDLLEGRFISGSDIDGQRRVIIVPDTFAREYFNRTDILGEEVRLTNYYGDIMKLKVIGVLNTEDDLFSSLLQGIEFPVEVIAPITTMQSFFGTEYVDQIQVSINPEANLASAGSRIIRLLEFVHDNQDKYLATSVEDIQKSVSGILNVISMVLLVIAIITLIVGGIGIINILLVSVTERIREIGIRKAIGAKKKDIVLQFLTESILMTGFSGLIGIFLGVLTGAIISSVIKIPPVVDIKTTLIAFAGSILLGIIFGVYPAKKAADLDPIESLRYE
ncbi:MAG: macrolide export ATP-binding/permease MacB [Firmicutes bacterium HGW-Firmicutes-3]|jgi:putative ABC transport system permease protein|nr:MAG: macrolide export ATP-binding/permease MacB [Firmicutes bacterium HGW-Firmicutes-3]